VPPTRARRVSALRRRTALHADSDEVRIAPLVPARASLTRWYGPQPAALRRCCGGAQPTAAPQRSRPLLPVGPFTHSSRDANGADRRTIPRRRSVGVQRQDAILTGMRRGHGDSAPITRFVRGSVAAHSRSARRPRARPRRPRRPHSSIGSEARSRETGNSPCRRPPAPAAPRGIGWGTRSHLRRFATAHSHLRGCV
jgi:hypothetical protein